MSIIVSPPQDFKPISLDDLPPEDIAAASKLNHPANRLDNPHNNKVEQDKQHRQLELLALIVQGTPHGIELAKTLKIEHISGATDTRIAKPVLDHFAKYKTAPSPAILEEIIIQPLIGDARKDTAERLNQIMRHEVAPGNGDYYLDQARHHNYDSAMRTAANVLTKALAANNDEYASQAITAIHDAQELLNPAPARRAYLPRQLADLPKPDTIVAGLLQERTLTCLWGEYGTLKSFLAIDLACSLATGEKFLQTYATKTRTVAYIAAEGYDGIYKRIVGWHKDRGISSLTERLAVLPCIFDLMESSEAEEVYRLAADALGTPPDILFIDTVARTLGKGSDSDAKDMGAYVNAITAAARKHGSTVIVIHHAGKDTSRGPKGSVSLPAACDFAWELRKATGGIEMHSTKTKDIPPFAAFTIKPEPIAVEGDEFGTLVVRRAEKTAEIDTTDILMTDTIQYLTHEWQTVKEIIAAGAKEGNASRHLKDAVTQGIAERAGQGGKSDPSRYRLTPQLL